MARLRRNYLTQRREFEPGDVRLAIIAESPPASGLYFYDPSGRVGEPLFAAMMRQIGYVARTKVAGLRELQARGWILVDATYEPVNGLSNANRDRIIVRDYPLLRADLRLLIGDRAVPVVLVKANVCKLLEPRLVMDGFDAFNGGRTVYFPSTGRQKDFERQFGEVVGPALNRP